MTDTVRNRSAVLAQFLRASVRELEDNSRPDTREPNAVEKVDNALHSIVAVAEELEAAAAAPDPVEVRRG
jgi:hypothetical protein